MRSLQVSAIAWPPVEHVVTIMNTQEIQMQQKGKGGGC